MATAGAPLLLPQLTSDEARGAVKPEYRPYVERYGLHSAVVVPLLVRGRVIGTIYASRDRPGRPYTAADQAFLQDLADRAALALDNARLYGEAREALAARDQFLLIAAHELRTPVAGVRGYAQLLQRQRARGRLAPERLARALEAIEAGTARLDRLTEDLLDVSRLRTGRLALRARPLDLAAFAAEAVGRYRDRLDPRHDLAVEATAGPCPVLADADRLEQVLTNLLDNAAKYSPEGGVIRVTVGSEGDGVGLRVRDAGIGLPPDALEVIFQPFGRARNAADLQIPGLGLGLYICRDIVERHGGRIWAESPGEGQGTTIHVWLPAEQGSSK